jgi:hypothetical protein
MGNYQTLLVFAPTTDICYDNWQEHINKRYFKKDLCLKKVQIKAFPGGGRWLGNIQISIYCLHCCRDG